MKSQTLVIITFKMIGHVEWYLINIREWQVIYIA